MVTTIQAVRHTPGPWRFDVDVVVSVKDRDGDWPMVARPLGPNAEANARVIAASPSMLELLQSLKLSQLTHDQAKLLMKILVDVGGRA
jgi:hypothetical protein